VLLCCVAGCQTARPSASVSRSWSHGPPRRLALIEIADADPRPDEFSFYGIGGIGREFRLGEQLSSCLHQELLSAGFGVIERERVKDILDELDLQASDIINSEHAKRFGRIAGVDSIVVGTSDYLEHAYIPCPFWSTQEYRASARIVNVETGEVRATLKFDKSIVLPLWFAMVDTTLVQRSVKEAVAMLPRGGD